MDSKIKVSIIVPVYNAEKYLDKTITSLIEQTLEEIEIICVNDGSTDKSEEILNKYKIIDSRVKVITQKNLGQSAARNTGIKAARGEYVGFLDSDDWADINAFEKLYNKADGGDIVIGNICTYNEKLNTYNYDDSYLSINVFPKDLFDKKFLPSECTDFLFRISVTPWNKIYRRDFILKNNLFFYENLNFEDNLFFLETFLTAKTITLSPEAVIFYRAASAASYSHSNGKNDYKKLDFFKITSLQEKFLKRRGVYKALKNIFNLHKKQTLFYWRGKISNPIALLMYNIKLFLSYPLYLICGKCIQRLIFKYQLSKLLNQKETYIWLEENQTNFYKDIIKKLKIKNALFLTSSETLKTIDGFSVSNIKDAAPRLVLAITSGIYSFDRIIKTKLEIFGVETEVKKLVFPI